MKKALRMRGESQVQHPARDVEFAALFTNPEAQQTQCAVYAEPKAREAAR